VGAERLDERGPCRIAAGLAAGNRFDCRRGGRHLDGQELLRAVYAAGDVGEAGRAPVAFYRWCAEVDAAEVNRLASTISAWQAEVLAYHTTGCCRTARRRR
jgi:hypothetical protein